MDNDTKNVLPPDFDGIFRFTNKTDEDFVFKWNGVEYTFPAMKTSPMIIPDASPEQVQNIRMKAAKKLAEREFFKSENGKRLSSQERNADGSPRFNSFQAAPTYSETDLAPFIQSCLDPLPVAAATSKMVPEKAPKLRVDAEGNPVTEVIRDSKKSLRGAGTVIQD